MKYLHTMARVNDPQKSLDFCSGALRLRELRCSEHAQGRFTRVFLAALGDDQAQLELNSNLGEHGHPAIASLGTSPAPWTTSTPVARSCRWRGYAQSHRATAAWRSCAPPAANSAELLQRGEPLPPTEP